MTVYDSSVLIDYLDDRTAAVEYVDAHLDERAVTVPLAMFEVYQGEVFKRGDPEFDAVDTALEWVTVVEETRAFARGGAELQYALTQTGEPLSARDAYIAGAAYALGERLVVADSDFDVRGLTEHLDIDFLPQRE